MTRKFLLPKSMAQRIAKNTGAMLIMQWAYHNNVSQHWNATDHEQSKNTHVLNCWITLVVKDDEPRSTIELMHAAQAACRSRYHLCTHIYRRKEALRKLKTNHGHIAMVYRCGYPLLNTDKKAFPKPGHARNDKQLRHPKPLNSSRY